MKASMMRAGMRFGRLVAIREVRIDKHKNHVWEFSCDCGTVCEKTAPCVACGATSSCGCRAREESSARMKTRLTTHNLSRSKEYRIWAAMKTRCITPSAMGFKNYGGRGIGVCERWLHSFENFYADMGPRPPGLTLERIDVNGNYEPSNCRWVTVREQQRNTRKNRRYTYKGESLTVGEWAEKYPIKAATLAARLRHGWSIEKAIETPVIPPRSREESS